jgi:predicted dienelactone hydrolase
LKVFLLTFFFLFEVHAAGPFGVGQKDFVFKDSLRNRELSTHVWYPVDSKAKLSPEFDKSPFVSPKVAKDVPLLASTQKYPVVLLSHGSMGLAKRLFWITGVLVRHGYIVIGVDHPGNKTGDSSVTGLVYVWERAKDLSLALDQVHETPEFKNHLDLSKVAAIGHSAGGTTVLLLGGGRFSWEHFSNPTPNCEGSGDPFYAKQCAELETFAFKSLSKNAVEADYTDKRVKSIIALDPGFVRSFKPETLKKMNKNLKVFIADQLSTPQDEIYSKEFPQLLPEGTAEIVPNTYHMSFMSACKPGLPKDDSELKVLCAGNEQKLKIQSQLAAKILGYLP